jgi:hypothetical protein
MNGNNGNGNGEQRRIRYVDLFCGIGGFRVAIERGDAIII